MHAWFRKLSVALCVAAGFVCGCRQGSTVIAGTASSPDRGRTIITINGCGKCHTIPGIHGAHGVVGPPLQSLARRTYIAGNFANTPENLTQWIMMPQKMKPQTAMPSLGLSEQQARDVVAYLETLQ